LTETFLDLSFDFSGVFNDYLKFHAPARKMSYHGRNSGGVLLLVRKNLEQKVKEIKLGCDNTLAIRIDKDIFGLDKDVILVACYIVPEGSPVYKDKIIKDGVLILEEVLLQYFNKDEACIMITGDLNARTGHDQAEVEVMMNYMENIDYNNMDEDEFSRCSKDDTINNFGKSLLNLCFLFDVYILNGFCSNNKEGDFTFVSPNGSSVIDYFLIPCNLLSNFDLKVGDCLHSWHLPVEVTWNTMNNQIEGENAKQQREEKILWSEENATVYENELESDDFYHSLQRAFEILTVDVNDSLDQFVKALCGAAACMVRRVGQGRKKCNDWFDEECERKKQEVKRLLKRFQRCKTKNDKEEKRKAYTKSRKEYVKLRKIKEQEFMENRLKKIKDSVNDSKTFWTIIRSVNRKSFVYNEIPIQQWHDHFFSVFNDPACNIATDEESITEDEDDCEPLFNSPISNEEVIAAIRHLKSGKSAGPDKIVAEMLKHANTVIIDFLTRLFNQLFENATFPSEWAKSIIIPIHKKGDVNNPDNYRGVALTSIVSKVYTHILNKRLTTWSQREEKISKSKQVLELTTVQ
jgi:hypothetical protein